MSNQLQVSGEAKIRAIQGPVVANSGVITALDGDASEYVRGDGTLADFPTSTGGGSSVSYYLNTSVSQGTIGGVAYKQLSKTPISGAGTDVTTSANGYIASYITDANDPALLEVPAGNFNCEFYFSVNSNAHNPYVYAEVYKYDGTTFTLLGSNVSIPQYLSNGTTLSPYYFAIAVSTAVLTVTDRIAIRIYVNVDGRTVTLHTENNHLCQVVTTFSKGLISLNNLTRQNQFFGTGTSGTDFAISSSVATHTFNLPVASASNTGKLSSTDWSTFNGKVPYTGAVADVNLGLFSLTSNTIKVIGDNSTYGGVISIKQNNVIGGLIGTGYTELFGKTNRLGISFGAGSIAYLSNSVLTAERTFTLPDITGTLALLEGSQTFTGLKTFGDSIQAGYGISLYNGIGTGALVSATYTGFYAAKSGTYTNITFAHDGAPYFSRLKLLNNATYDYTFPAASGTIALTSDLSSYVPYTGATQSVNLAIYGLSAAAITIGQTSTQGYIHFKTGGPTLLSANTSQAPYGISGMIYSFDQTSGNYKQFVLDSSLLTNNTIRTYSMPNATGTLALTSDIPSLANYVTLNGIQTITGGKTFTSDLSVAKIAIANSNTLYTTTGYTTLSASNVGSTSWLGLVWGNGGGNAAVLAFNNTAQFTYTFPATNGTLALLSGTQTFTGATTFSSDLLVSGLTIGRGGSAVVGNTAIGAGTLAANTTGVFNTAIGYYALASNTIGVSNTAIGANSLLVNTTGNNNTAIGTDSLNVNTTGSRNTAIGYYALNANTTANNNAAIGYYTLVNNTTGAENLGVGNEALRFNTLGNNNVAIGNESLRLNTTGTSNTSIGVGALYSNTTGGNNIAIGYNSATSITTGSNNTIIGGYVGTAAMANNIVLADGAGTIRYQWNGTNNAFTGAATFSSSVTAGGKIFTSASVADNIIEVINSDTTNGYGLYVRGGGTATNRYVARFKNAADSDVMWVGNTGNVGIGTGSPAYKFVVSNGGALGLEINPAGAGFTEILNYNRSTSAYQQLQFTASSIAFNNNVLIGTTTDTGKKLEVNGEVYSAGAGAAVFIQARDLSLNYAFFAPDATALNFYSTSGGTVGNFNRTTGVYTATSDINKKKDFEESKIGLDAILKLKPTLYRMKLDDNNSPKQLGFIAQEVKEFIPQAYVESDEMIGLSDRPIIATLVKAVQELSAKNDALETRLQLLENK